ncbi:MAG: bifunctional homocysteine S-methyltransferase/methylenetetrahydrofolate reductase, partial [Geobacter sp.]
MNFLERLYEQVLVGDGAIGTMLYARGVTAESGFERLNLTNPDLVLALHADYIAAGAQVIETNTFAANRLRLQQLGLEANVRQINLQGVALARKAAAGKEVFVAGSIGPLPRFRGENAAPTSEEISTIFREQAFV